ncbi:hydroxymethylbilane synthase [Sutterella sp.]|uniref:hydroxymethylbilane synthase n=1 Tax=Sutterella sp. TaxID=1981025 RepID=UPI0026DED54F|nr:hydroxymethylbilane synthase [Sutterella sp.]MDO5531534.1 hydroxymethylbilane synthase [Sutterella sp.]
MSDFDRCVIATRESPLAMWQALHVQALLRDRYPGAQVDLLGMTTRGDQILDRTLSKVGGKGLFVKELETAMERGEADLAVHSLKDVPMVLPEGFELVAVSEREDPRDAFVSPKYASLDEMPAGARVGTASLRRELMLRMRYPHLQVLPVRGNVGTRLRKLDAGEYDALVMASAGLKRLELHDRIRMIIPAEVSLPSPGQGALGIEIREGDRKMEEALAFINCPETRACCFAERAVSRALGGSCQVPLAAYAIVENGELWLRALVGNHHTGEAVTSEARGPLSDPEGVAATVVADLRAKGAEAFLAACLGA